MGTHHGNTPTGNVQNNIRTLAGKVSQPGQRQRTAVAPAMNAFQGNDTYSGKMKFSTLPNDQVLPGYKSWSQAVLNDPQNVFGMVDQFSH